MSAISYDCPDCGGTVITGETTYVRADERGVIVIEHVPADVCRQCGNELFSGETMAELERLLEERPAPTRTMAAAVYELREGRYHAPVSTGVA